MRAEFLEVFDFDDDWVEVGEGLALPGDCKVRLLVIDDERPADPLEGSHPYESPVGHPVKVGGLVTLRLRVRPRNPEGDWEESSTSVVETEVVGARLEGGLRSWVQLPDLSELRYLAVLHVGRRWDATVGTEAAASIEGRRPVRRTAWTPERLRTVARIYREAIAAGPAGRVTESLMEEFNCARSTAEKLPSKARNRKDPHTGRPYLGPTDRGRKGEA